MAGTLRIKVKERLLASGRWWLPGQVYEVGEVEHKEILADAKKAKVDVQPTDEPVGDVAENKRLAKEVSRGR